MPIQASSSPYVVVVVVPTKRPSFTAAKQPFDSSHNRRRQSSSVWFQPAASFSCIAAGMSDSNNKRISIAFASRISDVQCRRVLGPDVVRRLHTEVSHLLHVPLRRPIKYMTQVQQPREQPIF